MNNFIIIWKSIVDFSVDLPGKFLTLISGQGDIFLYDLQKL